MDTFAVLELAHIRAERWANVVILVTVAVVFFAAVLLILVWTDEGSSKPMVLWSIATVFVILAVPISSLDIRNHFNNFEVPELQKYIVRILFMVPVYSVTCWLCLWNEHLYTALESLRSLYEAYVIWSFTYFLMAYLGPDQETIAMLLSSKNQAHHIFPVNHMLRDWSMGYEFLNYCKIGTLQYVVWKILNVAIVLLASLFGIYGDSEWTPNRVYIYVLTITNCSQMLAIYSLVLFYKATHFDLAPIRPLAKFLCIKAVVFFSFWQGCLVSGLVYFKIIQPDPKLIDVDDATYGKALQDFIICIEMFFFALAHHWVFSIDDFKTYGEPGMFGTLETRSSHNSSFSSTGRRPLVQAFLEAANPRDLVHDIRTSVRRIRRSGGSFSSAYDDDDDDIVVSSVTVSSASMTFTSANLPSNALSDDSDDEYMYMNNESALHVTSLARRSLQNSEAETKSPPPDVL